MKMTALSPFLIGCSLSLALGHSAIGKEKDEEEADDSESEVAIEKTVLAREVEDRFEPVKSFKSDDTFAVLVFLSEPKIGTRLKAIWTIVDADGMENKKILEKKIEITADAIKGVEEPNRINFSLTHDDPFPAGDYKTEIYLNDELVKTVEFKVK
jgi:hypothetical protein